ncbi:MAG: polymer-forming cytoskeletal protein [Clostridiales bacterium]|jgi:cytoskeletal protein CcmA (bactofilin family)|nr:polymer-forming cytoskeletal protein [Clostridiales bacterium]
MARVQDEFTKPTSTVIGNGFTIHAAKFTCSESESMRIDGTVIGDIDIEGLLNISETGRVDGHINAGSARVAGRIFGNVQCRNAIHLAATADVTGDVLTSVLVVDEGAVFTGRCQTHVSADEK